MGTEEALTPIGRCGRYLLLKRIAAGGMGEIFLGQDEAGRMVAVKRMLPEAASDPTFVGMFIDEARVTKDLEHENIAKVYEFGEVGSSYYLAMEWIDGASLLELLAAVAERGRHLPVPLAAQIVAGVASALDYAHRQVAPDGHPLDLVHRDVSPANIMITLSGEVKLLDFGMAKARTQLEKTQAGFVKGKFGYLAPEQILGKVDPRTDLFALGLCFYECLTGRQLFEGGTAVQTVMAIQGYKAPPDIRALRPDVSPELAAFARRALMPHLEERFQDGEEMRRAVVEATGIRMNDPAPLGALMRELFPERLPTQAPAKSLRPEGISNMLEKRRAARQRRNHLVVALLGLVALASGAMVVSRLLTY